MSAQANINPQPSQPELLAPAGNWECARAAVENGADAIYFGLNAGFNARARAANFHLDDLPGLMEMLHRQAVKGYVTLNTLVFTNELQELEQNVRVLADAGVDAVLVQDLGVAELLRELCPTLEVHASTQMTLTNAHAIEMAGQLGVRRVVLARELSIKEIRKIAQATEMPIEVFVHGALCVAYSGQCLTSESFGGRSANRGQCAQACRLPYELYCDDEPRDLGAVKYLLSPQDLAAHDLIGDLIDAGVCSLKVEGRLKTPEYVANVCQHYRQAIDAAVAGKRRYLSSQQQNDLEMSFSRGFSPGWLEGCDHKRLVPGLSSAKRGVFLGTVEAQRKDAVKVRLSAAVAAGDGIVLEGDRFAQEEVGSRVFGLASDNGAEVKSAESGSVWLALRHGTLDEEVVGKQVWKTDDPQLTKRLRKSFELADPQKKVQLDIQCVARVGEPIALRATIAGSPKSSVEIRSEQALEAARKHPATEELLREQLSRLGGTVYSLGKLDATIVGQPMVPLSVLGALRKEMTRQLNALPATSSHPCVDLAHGELTTRLVQQVCQRADRPAEAPEDTPSEAAEQGPLLRVLCRSLKQLEQVLASGVEHVIADFHDIRQYRDAVAMAKQSNARIELATLRIHKPGEDGLFRALEKHAGDGWLVRNLAALKFCRTEGIPFACDFSLNVTNPLTADRLMRWAATRVTASYDLNRDQLVELARDMPAAWLEVVIHQHMPMFHMEHCVFCSVLSPGKNKSDCGRPCDRHDVKLADRVGAKHVLHADIGCRNTLYNATAQSGAEVVSELQELGLQQFRVELLRDQSGEDTERLVGLYRQLLSGTLNGTDVWRSLKADNRVGVTRGTLEQTRNPLAIL